CARRINAFDFW
nr:immunoglobulin heavy chain junction region [Macaca mulatta]